MKPNVVSCVLIGTIAFFAAIAVFLLLLVGFFAASTLLTVAFIVLGAAGLLATFAALLRSTRCRALSCAYFRSGGFGVIGSIGMIIVGSLALMASTPLWSFLMIALGFFFLILFLGGLWSFLRIYFAWEKENHAGEPQNDYVEYISDAIRCGCGRNRNR